MKYKEKSIEPPESCQISVEDYLLLDGNSTTARYEYLDGELRMLAGGSIYHSIIATNVSSILHRQFATRPCAVFNSDIRLQLSQSRYVYPDVSVSCDQRDLERGNTIHYPCIVIEILSPGTEIIDRVKKLRYYREHPTIQAYIMIDSQKISVEMYRRVSKGWMLETFGLKDTLEIEDLAIQIPIEEVYKKITF